MTIFHTRRMSSAVGLLFLGGFLLHSSCSRSDYQKTFPVAGLVTMNGKPVEGATVTLVPSGSGGVSAAGTTDHEGKFSVKTYMAATHQPQGAIAGEYIITVSKQEVIEIPKELSPEETMEFMSKAPKAKSLLPEKYRNPEKSGFRCTVPLTEPAPLSLNLIP